MAKENEMTGRQIILKALNNEVTPRPAWLPFVGCHGGKLINKTATDYLQSADLLTDGLTKAVELYRPDGLPIAFDLQIEAEILGCSLKWANDAPPAVVDHPLTRMKIEDLPAYGTDKGRMPVVLEALDRMKAAYGDDIAFYGLICGPFTLALHLLGNDIFLDMYDEPDDVKAVIDYCADIGIATTDAYIQHGADVIGVVDPMTSQISPDHFHEFVTPSVDKVFDAIRERGARSSMFVCGDATRNLEEMCATHADNVSVDEQISLEMLKGLCGKYDKSFGGNIKLTSVLLLGDETDAKLEAIHIIEQVGNKGFVLAPGCDLPYATPEANLRAVTEMVLDPYARDVAKATLTAKAEDTFDDVALPDYSSRDSVILDVITLDSTSCAPCQYMMEAVNRAAASTEVKVYINEHKIKVRQGLGVMAKLGVKALPTICVDGDIKFASIIPDQATLIKEIEAKAREKHAL